MFFDNFKFLCDKKGVSCKRACTDMGLSNSIASKWKKTGATPTYETLLKVASYFGITVEEVLNGEESRKFHMVNNLSSELLELYNIVKDFSAEELRLLIARADKIRQSRD